MQVYQVLDLNKVSCTKKSTIKDVGHLIITTGIKTIPILDKKGEILGVFTIDNLAQALLQGTSLSANILEYSEKPYIVNAKVYVPDILGHPLHKVVVVDDAQNFQGVISQNKLILNLLQQRDNVSCNLNAILDTSNNYIISINQKGRISFINKSAAKLLDVPVQEALGQPVKKYIHNSRLPEIVRSGKSEIGQRFSFMNKTFITNRTPIIRNNKILGAVAVFQDITELQSTMEELTNVKQYQEILETVVDNDYDCIVVVDATGIITMFNKAYENFIKVPREKAIGKHVTEVIENTRMHIVAKTGKAEIADIQKIFGHEMICNRIPIKKDGKIWGVVGKTMFKDVKELRALIDKVNTLQTELEYYKDFVMKIQGSHFTFDNIIGDSGQFHDLKCMAKKVALNNSTVLIRGESGTGKELFAHAIHSASPRKNHPFIKVNCSAIPDNLLESELFGYDEGAFTGAKKGGKLGKFELANKGTIFLDEIGDMPLNMQVKLLRVLQEKEIERVGGTKAIPIDVRVLAATNRPLEELIKEDKFRLDLYYRLNVVEIKIPPIRNHKEDIPELINYLLYNLAIKMGYIVPSVNKEALDILMNYHWPGNIRELENVLERCLNFVENNVITPKELPYHIRHFEQGEDGSILLLKDMIEEAERTAIINALKICADNKVKAAKMLGISRASIYQKIDKYKIC